MPLSEVNRSRTRGDLSSDKSWLPTSRSVAVLLECQPCAPQPVVGFSLSNAKQKHDPPRCGLHRRHRLRIDVITAPNGERPESRNGDRIAASGEDSWNGATRRLHSALPRSEAGKDLPGDPARFDASADVRHSRHRAWIEPDRHRPWSERRFIRRALRQDRGPRPGGLRELELPHVGARQSRSRANRPRGFSAEHSRIAPDHCTGWSTAGRRCNRVFHARLERRGRSHRLEQRGRVLRRSRPVEHLQALHEGVSGKYRSRRRAHVLRSGETGTNHLGDRSRRKIVHAQAAHLAAAASRSRLQTARARHAGRVLRHRFQGLRATHSAATRAALDRAPPARARESR